MLEEGKLLCIHFTYLFMLGRACKHTCENERQKERERERAILFIGSGHATIPFLQPVGSWALVYVPVTYQADQTGDLNFGCPVVSGFS